MLGELYLSYLASKKRDIDLKDNREYTNHKIVYNLFKEIHWFKWGVKVTINPIRAGQKYSTIYEDLNLFMSIGKNKPLTDILNRSRTLCGKIFFQKLLYHPTSSLNLLEDRSNCLQELSGNGSYFRNFLDWKLKYIQEYGDIDELLWFFQEHDHESHELFKEVYFSSGFLKYFNSSGNMLNFCNNLSILGMPFFTIFSPIISIITPLLIMKYFGLKITFLEIIKSMWSNLYNYFFGWAKIIFKSYGYLGLLASISWIGLYFYGVYTNIKEAYDKYCIIYNIHHRLCCVARVVRASVEIYKNSKNIFNKYEFFKDGYQVVGESLNRLHRIFGIELFDTETNLFGNKGLALSYFRELEKDEIEVYGLKYDLKILLQYLGLLDAHLGIAKLIIESRIEGRPEFCFPKYLNDPRYSLPTVKSHNLWHPNLLNKDKINHLIVYNDMSMHGQNIILTGPNQGGKSTFIKSLLLNLWLGQSLCVANAGNLEFTPFRMLHSYIGSSDNLGYESLFESEMNKMDSYLKSLENLRRTEYAFAVVDEIFTSTNYKEAIAAGLAIGHRLAKFENNLCILTTHYKRLTQLENETNKHYKNYQVTIERNANNNNEIKFLYKIIPGISCEEIALELLEKKGFRSEIIDLAKKFLQD